jgi:hypothetical protein
MKENKQSKTIALQIKQILVTFSILFSLGLLCAGIYQLNNLTENTLIAYSLISAGSILLILLPSQARINLNPLLLKIGLVLALGVSAVNQVKASSMLLSNHLIAWQNFSSVWLVSLACFVAAFAAWQQLRKTTPVQQERIDMTLSWMVFFIAFLLRSWNVVTRSPIAIQDEIQVFSGLLSTGGYVNVNPLTTLNAFPSFYYWAISYLYRPFYPMVDLLMFQKLLVAAAGAASVSLWYLIVRHFHTRSVALVLASLLSFMGWHWVNSRFLYCYPYDLAFSAAGILCTLISLRDRNVFHAMLAGLFCSLTIIFQKSGLLVCPLIAYIFFEKLIKQGSNQRKETLLCAAVWAVSIAFFYMPFVVFSLSPNNPEGVLPRQMGILAGRNAELARAGIGQLNAVTLMITDVFLQLQRFEFDHVRHIFRLNGPILEPVLSGLFILGFVRVVFSSIKEFSSRMCLIGFALFSLPMIISFPIDSGIGHGLSRRMLCCSPFVAWMAALGASLAVQRIVPSRLHITTLVALCCGSAYGNFFYLMKDYLGTNNPRDIAAHKDLAIQRSSSTLLLRSLATSGFQVIYYWDSRPLAGALSTTDLRHVTLDFPNIKHVDSIQELRSQISNGGEAPQFIVIPASTVFMDKFYQDIPSQISDLVPSHLWIPGPTDTHMIPTSWYAFVRAFNKP